MKKILLVGILALGLISVFCLVKSGKDNEGGVQRELLLPPEIVIASKEFKKQNTGPESLSRTSLGSKLFPYIKKGMSKEQVKDLLGEPSSDNLSKKWTYSTSLSSFICIYFDEHGKVIQVDGTGSVFLSVYDRNWPFIRIGMKKDTIASKLYEPTKILDDGKTWEFHAQRGDPNYYYIYFDKNDEVIKLEKTKVEKD